jgi:hypothetical protein
MKTPVSLEYVIVVTLLAAASAVLTYNAPSPALNLATLLLGIYALHLVSLRIVVREFAGTAAGRPSRRSRRQATEPEEILRIREELEQERAELANRKSELQERIVAAEQQWELLRQMIREKVGPGESLPDSVVAASEAAGGSLPGRSNGSDQPPRIHGRW